MRPFNFVSLSALFHAGLIVAIAAIPALKLLPEKSGKGGTEIEITEAPGQTHDQAPLVSQAPPLIKELPLKPEPPAKEDLSSKQEAPQKAAPIAKVEKPLKKSVETLLPAKKKVVDVDLSQPEKIETPAEDIIDASTDDPKLLEVVEQAQQDAEQFSRGVEEDVLHNAAEVAAKKAVDAKNFYAEPKIETTANEDLSASSSASTGASDTNTPSLGGQDSGVTRSYLDLQQLGTNRPPRYPELARRSGQQGEVILKYFVTKNGTVTNVQLVQSSGYASLDQETIRAIQQYQYVPGQEGWAIHPVMFSLKGEAAESASRLRTARQGE